MRILPATWMPASNWTRFPRGRLRGSPILWPYDHVLQSRFSHQQRTDCGWIANLGLFGSSETEILGFMVMAQPVLCVSLPMGKKSIRSIRLCASAEPSPKLPMPRITYYVAIPFVHGEDSTLTAGTVQSAGPRQWRGTAPVRSR